MGAHAFEPGQIVTVFRSRLRDDADGYPDRAAEIAALAAAMPGLVDVKAFTSADGERVTLVTFADEASHAAWRDHPEHLVAQQQGRDEFYTAYSIQVCEARRVRTFGG
jgi:heme-degrading monooxygenase HmoA